MYINLCSRHPILTHILPEESLAPFPDFPCSSLPSPIQCSPLPYQVRKFFE